MGFSGYPYQLFVMINCQRSTHAEMVLGAGDGGDGSDREDVWNYSFHAHTL